jgi:hypothetical protein
MIFDSEALEYVFFKVSSHANFDRFGHTKSCFKLDSCKWTVELESSDWSIIDLDNKFFLTK